MRERDLRIIKGKMEGMKIALRDARRELDRVEQWANGIIYDIERGEEDGKRQAQGKVV